LGGHQLEAVGKPQDDAHGALADLLLDGLMQRLAERAQMRVTGGARILDPVPEDGIVVAPAGKLAARAADLVCGGGDGLPRSQELGRAMPVDPTELGTPSPGCGCTGHWIVSEDGKPGVGKPTRSASPG
jgi:hypothetical protein